MNPKRKLIYMLMMLALVMGMLGVQPMKAVQAANPIRISQVYGGGGNSGSTYTHDFIELFNSSSAPVNLAGWSVQYASSTGTSWQQVTALTGMIPAYSYYLIQENPGNGGSTPLPTPDVIGSISMSATKFKVALVDSTTPLTGSCPTDVVDLVGAGEADCKEGTGTAPAPSNTTAIIRKAGGCQDTDDNAADFEALAPTPRNTASPTHVCAPATFPERFIISEYIEGSSNNKAIELYNGTGVDIDLHDFKLVLYTNGSTDAGNTLTWNEETVLADGDTYVIAHPSAIQPILDLADTTSNVTYFNGNDALVLFEITTEGDVVQDSFGQRGFDPGTAWGSGDTATAEHTLVRKATVCHGDILPDDVFEPSLEYNGFPQNTYTNLGSHTMTCGDGGDVAPTVESTIPADGALNVAVDADIIITFSEPVTVAAEWFTISCDTSGPHTAMITDADPVYTLDPDTDFAAGEVCTVTVLAANVADLDDPVDNMAADYAFSFTTVEACGAPFTPIYTIQGDGAASPLVGQPLTTEGVVVGDFQTGGKDGFFIQDQAGDGDPATSDGIFVYYPSGPTIAEGDKIRLTGTVKEYFGLTQINGTFLQICTTGNSVEPVELTLPFENKDLEHLEGMLVTFPQALVISEYYNFDRYGELLLTSARHTTPTAIVEPGQDAIDMAAYHLLDSIALDDGSSYQNPSYLRHPDGSAFGLDNYFRGGDTVAGLTGVLDYNFNVWKVQPVGTANYEALNLRTDAPELVDGEIRIASLNVLNYFVTLDLGPDICGPSGTMGCRGANTPEELERQQAKIVNAILGMDADVVGLIEIENEHPGQADDEAVISLVNLLNAEVGASKYSYIATGPLGSDAIKQAFIYNTDKVEDFGDFALLDSSVDSRFDTTRNRPSLAQTFKDKNTNEIFTVSVNHLKSKGSACVGDPDLGDGAGNCNLTRKAAAEALVEWLETDPTETGSDMYVIIGDLNSYAMEDPIDMIKLGGDDLPDTADDYFNLVERFQDPYAYGYVFDGQTGYLDHALGNRKFASYVLDANFWHINADETKVFDYDMTFKPDPVDAMFDPTTPYRASDHDPVLISVLLNHAPVATDDAYTTLLNTVLQVTAPGVLANDMDVNIYDKISVSLVPGSGPLHGVLVFNEDGSFTYTPDPGFVGQDSFEYVMLATPGLMDNYSDTATVTITVTAKYMYLPLIAR